MSDTIRNAAADLSVPRKLPDGTPYQSLSVEDVRRLSARFGITGRNLEIAALENGVIPERYARNVKTLSADDQIRLLASRVSIVGLGGLGGTVTDILARVGIGELTLIDGDAFEDSNLNRQLLATEETVSGSKADAAEKRVRQVNSSVNVQAHRMPLTESNAARLLEGSDVVVDCLDTVSARFTLEDAAKGLGTVLVSAAVAGVGGHVTTIFPGDAGLRLIYGEPGHAEDRGVETTLGNLPTIVCMVASLECGEVIKVLTDPKNALRNRLLVADLTDNTFEVMQLV